jgi:hypothetical protein
MKTIATVQHIYAAFGRGDVPAILECLADDIEWEYGTAPNPAPWLQRRHGKAAVPGFFAALADFKIEVFRPLKIFGDAEVVMSLIDLAGTVQSTGKRIVEPAEVHIWQFRPDGLVQRFRHAADTWQQGMACKA